MLPLRESSSREDILCGVYTMITGWPYIQKIEIALVRPRSCGEVECWKYTRPGDRDI